MTTKVVKRKQKTDQSGCPVGEKKHKPNGINGGAVQNGHQEQDQKSPTGTVDAKKSGKTTHSKTSDGPQDTTMKGFEYVENFRQKLLAGVVAMDAIRHFVQQFHKNPESIVDYISGGGTLQPLMDILDKTEKDKVADVAELFHLIHFVLIKCTDYDEMHANDAAECARYIMTDYKPVIVRLLREKEEHVPACRAAAFRILKAIMLVDSGAYGREVLKLMDVCMPELEMHKCRETVEKQETQESLRTVFIEFNLVFLIDTAPEVVRLWLSRAHLLQPLVQNLVYDYSENVVLFMKSFRQYVLECAAIDKYIYRTIFTTDFCKALVNVYEWVGPSKQVPTEDMKNAVLNATEKVVLPLLTFKRYYLAPNTIDLERASPRNKHILLALKNSHLNAHQRRLVLRLFETCPEVLPAVLENYGALLKTKIENNRELLMSILKLHKPADIVAGLDASTVTAKALSNFVVKSTLPRTALEYIGVAMGRRENIAFCMKLLAIMIGRCEQYLLEIEKARLVDQFGLKKLKFDTINQILALFPSVDRIISAMEQHRYDRNVEKPNVAMEDAMDILLVCIRSFRAYIESSTFITTFQNILQPAYRTPGQERFFLNYEFKAIKVVIALEPQSVSFDSPQFPSVLKLVTKIYLNASDDDMHREATELLVALFRNTSLFGNRTTEIEFWFQALYEIKSPESVLELVDYLASCAKTAAKNMSEKSSTAARATHSLIDEAFEEAGLERRFDLEELFARVEHEANDIDGEMVKEEGTTQAFLTELSVTDNFFLYMFAKTTIHPAKFTKYFDRVLLRYLHYLPHPEIVEKALVLALEKGNTSVLTGYVHKWMSRKGECVLGKDFGWGVLYTLGDALVKRWKDVTICKPSTRFRTELILMLHQTMFHLCRLVAVGTLTQEALDIIEHYTEQLLTAMLDDDSPLSDTDIEEVMAGLFLQRPVLFDHFTIRLKQGDDAIPRLVTGFVYKLMEKFSHLPNFDRYAMLYSHKIVSELINSSTTELIAPLDSAMAEKLLAIFKLNERNCVTLLRHYAKLPVEAFLGAQPDNNQRTFHYKQLCLALEQLAATGMVGDREHFLTERTVRGLVRIYMECGKRLGNDPAGLDDFERSLQAYLGTFTHNIAHVEPEMMNVFFVNRQRIGKPLVKLATFLLSRDARFDAPFLALVGEHSSSKKELVYPLLNVAFRRSVLSASTVRDSDDGKRLLNKLYAEFKGGIQKMLEKPHKAAVIYRENTAANEALVRLCMPRNECVDFARKKLRIESVEVFQLRVLMEIYGIALDTLKDDPKQQPVVYGNVFGVLLQCFDVLFRSSSSAEHFLKRTDAVRCLNQLVLALYDWSKQMKRYKTLREAPNFEGVTSSANWNAFCKTCLKFGMEMPHCEDNVRRYDDRLYVLPTIMATLVDLFYANDNPEQKDIERYYDWALSHSSFLRLLLIQFQFRPKTALVHLLCVLAHKNTTVANSRHVPLFLGAYGATLSDCNRYILALLQLYERAGVQMHEFRPFLWGEMAIKHFSLEADANEENNCQRHSFRPHPSEVFSLLAKENVCATILRFPVWRQLDACAQLPAVNFDDIAALLDPEGDQQFRCQPANTLEEFVEKQRRRGKRLKTPPAELLEQRATKPDLRKPMYDPAFLLPLLEYLFAPENSDMLDLAGRAGILSLPFVCLASNDEQMRLAAGSVIVRLRGHLEQTRKFIDAQFWLHLFSVVQNGLAGLKAQRTKRGQKEEVLPKASFLSTIYIAETINVLPDVLSELHAPLTRYIIQQQTYDFRAIPNFMVLFHSADVKHNVHRLFMLESIYRGIQTHEDFGLLRSSPILRAVMHFYASSLSNRELNITILNIINSLAKIPKSCDALVSGFGFLSWLSQRIDGIESFHFDTIEAFLEILSNCWCSMQLMAFAKSAARSPISFQRGVLIATLKFLPLLSTRSSSKTLTLFLNLLEKTTSSRYSNDRLLTLVNEQVLRQMMEYFEKLFGAHLWCVRYVRQCGALGADDDATIGRKLSDGGVDKPTISILVSLRRFVIRWQNFQQHGSAGGDEMGESDDEQMEVKVKLENVQIEQNRRQNFQQDGSAGGDDEMGDSDDDQTEVKVKLEDVKIEK
ncbi:hypothetical protein ZHAS_00018291 [Anopheles sinensis]|uniref:Nucleolar pre-ribosomal-associated protein 1 n=1 Tax=Anopheles sinensis TaxID=74873 RepID=A0A084WJ27_ANOSI|nr:hypothetical protein ZHAS_00018291 [Anopheles sinensis]